MSQLDLYFIGSPLVYLDGVIVKIDRRKVLALLAYLAVTAQRHSRDELAELLYGRQDRDHARSNLRQTLSLLRNAIGKDYIGTDRLGVWMPCTRNLWIDIVEFQHLRKKGQAADIRGNLSTVRSNLSQAVELFRGDFLSGFYLNDSTNFEDWQLLEQQSLHRQQASSLQRLVEIHGARGEYEQAIDYGHKWLSLDPLEETVHRQLMRLNSLAGQHFEALRQYERCQSVLERELGEKPEEETERLHEHIVARKLLPGSSTPLLINPLEGTPLFMFAQISATMKEQVIQQETLLHEEIGKERGRTFSGIGQMLCAIFPTAEAAVRTALGLQVRALAMESGMRIVLLAGELTQQQVPCSMLVERAGMLLEISYPGQIILNNMAAEFARNTKLPEGSSLFFLGAHRLKDLGPAQPVTLLENTDLTHNLRQINTLDNRPNNLKIQPTPFIGRKKELEAVWEIFGMENVRLLTLTGAGGTGKTRLALQASAGMYARFEQGLFFVDLAALNDPTHILETIASVLNVRESGGTSRSLMDTLKDYLGGKQILLLLDNFEHLMSAAPKVAELLASCPQLKILATSREVLHLRAERVFQVPPMKLPSQGQRIEVMKHCEALRLFTERATAVRSTFELDRDNIETVAEICIRLDGLPLAIELAAMHIRMLTPRTLLMKLENMLNLLEGGPRDLSERQQTLRNEMDWSYELLKPGDQYIFMRLSVFPVGCTLDAAEEVCCFAGEELDIFSNLSSLTEKSLVRIVDENGESRFRMLVTIHEYAHERLKESGHLNYLEQQFAVYFLQLAEKAEPELYGSDQMKWFDRIENEYDNIRAALTGLYNRRDLVEGLRLAGALGWFWFRKARFSEGQHWLELFRNAAGENAPPGPRAKAAYYLGWMRLCVSSVWGNPEGKHFFRESLRLWREVGNQRGIALSQVWLAWEEGDIEGSDGWILADDSVAIARETGEPWVIAWCLKVAYAHLRRQDKDLESRRAALEEAIDQARKAKDPFLISQTLNGMGNVFNWIRELEAAEPWYRDSLLIAREIGDSWSILENIYYLADGNLGLGRIVKAKELFSEGLRLSMDYGARGYLGWFIGGFYTLSRREGRNIRAVRLGAISESILNPYGKYNSYFAKELGLSEKVAAAEWEIGQTMTLEQAVDYTLMDE